MSTQSSYQISRLQGQDPQQITAANALYQAFAIEEGHSTPPEQFADFLAARSQDDQVLLSLAYHQNSVVGFALVFDVVEHPFIPNWERSGYICYMFVLEAHRGQGVGRQLLDYSMAWLAERSVPYVQLNVYADHDHAQAFWRKMGFRPHLTRMRLEVSN